MLVKTVEKFSGLQREICSRLLHKLEFISFQPKVVVDLGAATGFSSEQLRQRFPNSQVIAFDQQVDLLTCYKGRWPWQKRWRVCTDYLRLPLAAQSVDMILVNIPVLVGADLPTIFAECYRVLKPNGLLLFVTLGVDTLIELRRAFAAVDSYQHVMDFPDMHNIGDLLTQLSFEDPVMDMETMQIDYPNAEQLLQDVRALPGEVFQSDFKGLMGKQRWQKMLVSYAEHYPLTIELIYGNAWIAKNKKIQATDENEVCISVESMMETLYGKNSQN